MKQIRQIILGVLLLAAPASASSYKAQYLSCQSDKKAVMATCSSCLTNCPDEIIFQFSYPRGQTARPLKTFREKNDVCVQELSILRAECRACQAHCPPNFSRR